MKFVNGEFLGNLDRNQCISYILGKIRSVDSQSVDVEIRRWRISLYLGPSINRPMVS